MWQDAKRVAQAASGMKVLEINPIILRHKGQVATDQIQVFGFTGFRFVSLKGISGQITPKGEMDPNRPLEFFKDDMGVFYGVLPDCDHNRKMLLQSARFVRDLPFVIEEGPRDLMDALSLLKTKLPEEEAAEKKRAEEVAAKKAENAANQPPAQPPAQEKKKVTFKPN